MTTAPTTATNRCPRCGESIAVEADECHRCGNETHSGSMKYIAAALVAILVVVALVAWRGEINRSNDARAGDPYSQCIRANGDDLICRTKK